MDLLKIEFLLFMDHIFIHSQNTFLLQADVNSQHTGNPIIHKSLGDNQPVLAPA